MDHAEYATRRTVTKSRQNHMIPIPVLLYKYITIRRAGRTVYNKGAVGHPCPCHPCSLPGGPLRSQVSGRAMHDASDTGNASNRYCTHVCLFNTEPSPPPSTIRPEVVRPTVVPEPLDVLDSTGMTWHVGSDVGYCGDW